MAEDTEDKKEVEANAADADAENTEGNPQPNSPDVEQPEDKDSATEDTQDNADADNDADAEDRPLDTDVWGSTGDEVGDSVLELLQNSDMSVEDAKALIYDPLTEHGDPTKLDKDALVEKVGKAKANLVMAGIENYVTKTNARTQEIVNTVYEASGGKDQWDKVAEWARKNVSDADRADYNDMLEQGGAKAKFAASEYVRLYNADSNNTSIGNTETLEGESAGANPGKAITRLEYAESLDKLHKTGKATPAAIAALQRARKRGQEKGI